MGFILPAKALAMSEIHPFFLNETASSYKTLFSLQQDPHFKQVDFLESMAWKQPNKSLNTPLFSLIKKNYQEFCSNITPVDYSKVPKLTRIPPILHFIWLGSEIPLFARLSIESWKMHHPGWEIKLWDDAAIEKFNWLDTRCKSNFYKSKVFAEKADILRCEVLYQYGGIYSDTDVICLKPFHDLLLQNLDFFIGIETNNAPLHLATCVIGTSKRTSILKYCIDHHLGELEAPDKTILDRTGPGLFTRACMHMLSTQSHKEKLLLLPITYFYPLPFKERNTPINEVKGYVQQETMAIHLWNGSWLPN